MLSRHRNTNYDPPPQLDKLSGSVGDGTNAITVCARGSRPCYAVSRIYQSAVFFHCDKLATSEGDSLEVKVGWSVRSRPCYSAPLAVTVDRTSGSALCVDNYRPVFAVCGI